MLALRNITADLENDAACAKCPEVAESTCGSLSDYVKVTWDLNEPTILS